MYWREITTRLAGGRSTPAMRAMLVLVPRSLAGPLALPLLVTRIRRADHPDDPLAADHLALVADLLHRRADLHDDTELPSSGACWRHPSKKSSSRDLEGLLRPIGDATPGEVIRRQFQLHLVARKDADEMHAHFPGDVGEHLMPPVVQDHPEHGVGKRLDDRPFHLDGIVLRHRSDPLRPSKSRQTDPFDKQTFVHGKARRHTSRG